MKQWGKQRWIRPAACALMLIALALVAPAIEVCTDYGYVCENTGSRKGHREWVFGLETRAWYEASLLEKFMRQTP